MKTISLRANRGDATTHYIENKEDDLWGTTCELCGHQIYSGNTLVGLRRYGYAERFYLCGDCFGRISAALPPDISDTRLAKVASKSKLVDWIKDSDASITPAL